ncbi:serine protease [Paenibacillus nasutitermitis]|uniref:Serine protease n=2 Tax=Paenibacillus nasutitermitis TaxID=1652958 RepID=A0A916YXR1_9BACL|nr:CAP domain-containing protein [Paenibacillus nasutitermitis]GGD66593.1 serine protease [Paenibacillus nasutitermitis]
MIKIIVIAGLLLATGCAANNNTIHKQSTPNNQKRIETHMQSSDPARVITRASSTSTSRAKQPTVTMKEAPSGVVSDLLNIIGGQAPAGNRGEQMPANPAGQARTGLPNNQVQTPANPAGQARTGLPNNQVQTPANPAGQARTGSPDNQVKTPAGQEQGGTTNGTQYAQQVLELVNQERSNAGLNPLEMNSELSNVAMIKAKDMYDNQYFDHNSPTHGSPFDLMKANGITYRTAGENIANGQTTPAQVMKDWMESPGHKANILNTSYTRIGIAYYNNEWVQEFTG